MPEPQWKAMFDAQCAWDATMAFNAVEALRKHGKADAVMVVLIGSGHVAYGLGIQRQAQRWYDGKMASLVPIPVLDERQRPVVSVQASYANFLWGLPHEKDPLYPELGIATGDIPGERRRKVLSVSSDSVAKDAGFQVGDVMVSMDGFAIEDREVLNRMLSEKRWGDAASFVVRRGEGEVPLEVRFRRTPPSIPTVARPLEGP
jgi:membrane-associated protease RseP (regulator of RpoE activity)